MSDSITHAWPIPSERLTELLPSRVGQVAREVVRRIQTGERTAELATTARAVRAYSESLTSWWSSSLTPLVADIPEWYRLDTADAVDQLANLLTGITAIHEALVDAGLDPNGVLLPKPWRPEWCRPEDVDDDAAFADLHARLGTEA